MNQLITKTIGDCLLERAKQTPDSIGVSDCKYSYTWNEVQRLSDLIAIDFLKRGIKKGTHVAIWAVNSCHWVISYLALMKIGAVSILINTCYKKNELEKVLQYADIEFLLYGEEGKIISHTEILAYMDLSQFSFLKEIIPLSFYDDYDAESSENDSVLLEDKKKLVSPFDTASVLFTSGTTSMPKGVLLSHYSLINNSLEIVKQMHWNSEDRMCISVPLFHCFGITAGILSCIHSGASFYLVKYYKTIYVLKEIEKHRCTILNGVPTMFMALVRNKERENYDVSSIKSGVIAGSEIKQKDYINICSELGLHYLQTSYGQTESSPCITISQYEDSTECKSLTAGKVISNIEVKVWKEENKCVCEPEESGEILTRGYHVMQGYYKLSEETRKTIDEEGWLHTGDIGYLDKNGYLHVTGRKKDIIIRGGENICPCEIENCIMQLPFIQQVKVIGIKADVLQEEIVACIIMKPNTKLNKQEIQNFVKENLADYKVPKYIFEFEEFLLTSSGKIRINELRSQIDKRIEDKED
ncbi:MAG: AMP-binding protein [Velocimicrobium sp.]